MEYWVGIVTFGLVFGYYGIKYLYRSLHDQVED